MPRTTIPENIKRQVLTEAGYRCAVPTCRNILAIDLHHIVEVAEDGGNDQANLLALCPTCHALYTRGIISRDSIHTWKITLVSLSQAFDKEAIDNLIFLKNLSRGTLGISGDGVLRFSHLIAAGLAEFYIISQNGPLLLYEVCLTPRGTSLVDAWLSGSRSAVQKALEGVK